MKQPRISKNSLKAKRDAHALKARARAGYRIVDGIQLPPGAIRANWDALQHNEAAFPDIDYPRFYADRPFRCRDCDSHEVWTARQQKWWYESAKGSIQSIAIRCRACRRKERQRVIAAREAQSAGLARKAKTSDQR